MKDWLLRLKKLLSINKVTILTNVIGFTIVFFITLIYSTFAKLKLDLTVFLIPFFGGLLFEKIKKLVYGKFLE